MRRSINRLGQLSFGLWLLFGLGVSAPAAARDWFVRAGAVDGDGSLQKPFADPWQALDKCEAGDAIHVAEGKYFGKSRLGTWKIPYDGVQLIGGYDKDFKERDPWKHWSLLLWDATSKNWPKEERLSSDAKNVVVDGIAIDMQDQNQYQDDAKSGRTEKPSEHAMRFTLPVTVRNSVIVNPGENGINCVQGSTIENNLVMNAVGWGVVVYQSSASEAAKQTAQVKNNTIVFSWDLRKPGAGGTGGAAVAVNGPANVTNNILAYSDNNAVYQTWKPDRVSITHNVFSMNLFSNLKFGVDGKDTAIDDKSMDLFEEVGLKAFDGNEVKNPQLDLDPKWMDRVSRRTASQSGHLDMNDWNQARQLMGLPLIGSGYVSASGVAPPYSLENAMRLLQPKASIQAGARKKPLAVAFSAQAGAAAPSKSYAPAEVSAWSKSPESVDGKALEMVIAVGGVTNSGGLPAAFAPNDHAAYQLYDQSGNDAWVTGFYRKGSSAQRALDGATGYYQSSSKPDRLYRVRGVAHVLNNYPKAGFFVESVEPYEAAATASQRPAGRDWFVRAGASGGNGSREKPFKDPFQALEKVQSGDTVHVTEGEYFGKLHAGHWTVDTGYVALLGGYDKDFKVRNPWKHPTRLYTPTDYKGGRGLYTIEGTGDHTGTIIDGFVFDRRTNNVYTADGDLDYSDSDKTLHIWLARAGCIVRNNVFLNGSEGAIRVNGNQTVENNIFINHAIKTVDVQTPGFGNAPFVFRNNTVAFAWDVKFGVGHGRTGSLLNLGGRVTAIIDNNIFEFADNDAIRLDAAARDVELTRNVFSHNLWSNVQKMDGWVVVDDQSWRELGDLGWKKLEGNVVMSAALPIDQKWFDVYLHRTAMTPGKVQMDDWNQLREILGQPVISTGGKAGTGFAPAYDWKQAVALFPKNPKVKAGARASDLPVSFSGVERKEESHDYEEVSWEVTKSRDSWDKLEGKRVMMKVVIRETDNQYTLPDVKKEDWQAFTICGPEGSESGGLPMRTYVRKGTSAERVLNQARGYNSGPPEETHVVKGIARSNRQLVAEGIEKGE